MCILLCFCSEILPYADVGSRQHVQARNACSVRCSACVGLYRDISQIPTYLHKVSLHIYIYIFPLVSTISRSQALPFPCRSPKEPLLLSRCQPHHSFPAPPHSLLGIGTTARAHSDGSNSGSDSPLLTLPLPPCLNRSLHCCSDPALIHCQPDDVQWKTLHL